MLYYNYAAGSFHAKKLCSRLYENLYSVSKHGRTLDNTNQIKTKQLQSGQEHLKLNSNLDTLLTHNKLGKAKPRYSWQYFTISIF